MPKKRSVLRRIGRAITGLKPVRAVPEKRFDCETNRSHHYYKSFSIAGGLEIPLTPKRVTLRLRQRLAKQYKDRGLGRVQWGYYNKYKKLGRKVTGTVLYIGSFDDPISLHLFPKAKKIIHQDPALVKPLGSKAKPKTVLHYLKKYNQQKVGIISGLEEKKTNLPYTREYRFKHNGIKKALVEIGGQYGNAMRFGVGEKLGAIMTKALSVPRTDFERRMMLARALPNLEKNGVVIGSELPELFLKENKDQDKGLLKKLGLKMVQPMVLKKVKHLGGELAYTSLLGVTDKDVRRFMRERQKRERKVMENKGAGRVD